MSALINFEKFANQVTHNGKVDLLVRKAMYLDDDYYHSQDRIKEGGSIVSKGELITLSHCTIQPLGIIDGKATGLSDYSFYLVIGKNGTIFIIQDLLNEKTR
jgi:hypothetical protein